MYISPAQAKVQEHHLLARFPPMLWVKGVY
jgi:hypothetical protein